MRKRNIAIMFRLNRKEAEALDKKVKKSGLNREAYLRQVITGIVPRDAPPPDYYSMMRELHKIGNNLNQIAQKAHVLKVMDVQRYDAAVRLFEQTVKEITEAVILPEKNPQERTGRCEKEVSKMATTSIWSVKGWLGKVVIYVENPEKTKNPVYAEQKEITEEESQGLSDVIAYAVKEEKTRLKKRGKEIAEEVIVMQQYVSGVNCAPATARGEMMAVKKRYGKDEGIMAFHGYQSFAPGECTPAMAHEIGVKLAEALWGDRFQVLVATHLDKENHLHNHFVVNSVSFLDGKRYHRTKQDYLKMRKESDRLCKEYALSVIEQPSEGKSQHYGEWRANQEEKPTYRGMIRADVDEAIRRARTENQFFHFLREKGYDIKFGRDITLRPAGRDRGLKLARNFGEAYTMEAIRRRILTEEKSPFPKTSDRLRQEQRRTRLIHLRGTFQPKRKIGGLRGLYLHYCYLLGILPKNRPPVNQKELHLLLREDLNKLNQIKKETRLLCRCHIDTAEQLFSWKETCESRRKQLMDERTHLRYRLRSAKDEQVQEALKAESSKLTEEIKELREEVKLCDGIAARSQILKEKIPIVRQETAERKEEVRHEHIRGSR